MRTKVRLFAGLRERARSSELAIDLPEDATVGDALDVLSRHPALRETLTGTRCVMAVNREYASADTRLSADDELALIPPVSGGAP